MPHEAALLGFVWSGFFGGNMQDTFARAKQTGWIEVIAGSMFSGKTEELIRILRRAQYARQPYQIFKPRVDDRYGLEYVTSHNQTALPATVITRAAEIFHHLKRDTKVVGIDEGQFFDRELVDVVNELADRGLRVVIAGLDMNWKGEPFHPMPELMAIAEVVKKQNAVCVSCGASASRTQRLVDSDENILVGGHKIYEARCRSCYDPFFGDAELDPVKTFEENCHEQTFE